MCSSDLNSEIRLRNEINAKMADRNRTGKDHGICRMGEWISIWPGQSLQVSEYRTNHIDFAIIAGTFHHNVDSCGLFIVEILESA